MKNIYLVAIWIFLLSACGQQSQNAAPDAAAEQHRACANGTNGQNGSDAQGGAEQSLTEITEPARILMPVKKYIALRHNLQIETPSRKNASRF